MPKIDGPIAEQTEVQMAAEPTTSPRPARPPIRTEVLEVSRLTPHMIRVVVGGDELHGFPVGEFTDHYVKLQFPPPGAPYTAPFDVEQIRATLPRDQWPRTRSYTVRDWDADRARLTLDFVYHGDVGVAGPWAAAAQPGDVLQLLGPGGGYAPDPHAAWYLLVGDASVVPAVGASLSRIPAGRPVHVVLEVHDVSEEQALPTAGDANVVWVHGTTGGGDRLLDAVRALDFPEGPVDVFLHGEAGSVRAIRRHLLVDREVPREALSVSGYWKRSLTDEGWRADKAAWKQAVEADTA